jgi:hypothetical protein
MGEESVENNFCTLSFANDLVFTISNWFELLFLIIMTYAIKDIKDELNIRDELIVIAITWFFFTLLYVFGRYYSGD